MNPIRSYLRDRVINPISQTNESIDTVGIVTGSDESNNTCDIRYVDKSGKKRNRSNVVVRLYGSGTDWFPSEGDAVIIQDSGDTCVIVARHIGNYNMEVRSKMELSQDIYSDNSGCQEPGGYIM